MGSSSEQDPQAASGQRPRPLLELGQRQKTTLGVAITVLSTVVILCAIAALFWLLARFLREFSNVFLPLAVAGVLALMLKPYFDWLEARLKLRPVLALIVLFLTLLIPLIGLGWFFGHIVVEQTSDLIERIPDTWQEVMTKVEERWPKLVAKWNEEEMGARLRGAVEGKEGALLLALRQASDRLLTAGADLFGAVGRLLGWAVLPIYLAFFLLMEPGRLGGWKDTALPFLKQETREDISFLVHEFVSILVAFFRGQLVIALLQGVLFAIGFSLVGLRYGLILGLLLGFLNIIPYLGSMIGLGIALPLAFFQQGGGLTQVIWVLVVFTAVQMIEGYILTPKIMGDRTGLHPLAIMVAMFFWGTALNGIGGMVLAIPLTAFFVVFWRLAREKYIQELV